MLSIMKKHPLERRKLQLGKKTVLNLSIGVTKFAKGGFGPSAECPPKTTERASESCTTCISADVCRTLINC
jgi:hypothetical protein